MKKDADEGFKASPEYNRMEQEIKSLSLSQSLGYGVKKLKSEKEQAEGTDRNRMPNNKQ